MWMFVCWFQSLVFHRFIEVYFAHCKTHHFQIYSSVIFSDFEEWYNHHHKSTSEHFHALDKNPQERGLLNILGGVLINLLGERQP